MATERLQKVLARAGISSRRAAEEVIVAGRVRVNGRVVTELGTKADPRKDRVEVDGRRIVAEQPLYVVVHKPRGVVSTMSDPEGRPSVKELVHDVPARVFPVGRLDFATSGVLLATNDGAFADGLMHPRKSVPKTYVLKVKGLMKPEDLDRWRRGVKLEDGMTLPAEVKFIRHEEDKTWLELTITEGRNQQIRRMGDATGFRVMRLARLSFAGISSEGLRPGQWRFLTREELMALKKSFGVPERVFAPAAPAPSDGRRTRAPERPHATRDTRQSRSRDTRKTHARDTRDTRTRDTRDTRDTRAPRDTRGRNQGSADRSPPGQSSGVTRGRDRTRVPRAERAERGPRGRR